MADFDTKVKALSEDRESGWAKMMWKSRLYLDYKKFQLVCWIIAS